MFFPLYYHLVQNIKHKNLKILLILLEIFYQLIMDNILNDS